MARFELAVERLLQNEAGYVDHPNDNGGATNFGISLRWYREHVKPDAQARDIKLLSSEDAIDLYHQHFWKYSLVQDQFVTDKLFDMAVNMGTGTAHTLLQRALNAVSGASLVIDGKFGPKTLAATNAADPGELLNELLARAVERYCNIVLSDPSQKVFLLGWIRRAVA